MTPTQRENKIEELKGWLEHNHSHPDRGTVAEDLRKLIDEQKKEDANAPGRN